MLLFVERSVKGDENPLLNQHLQEVNMAEFENPQMSDEEGEECDADDGSPLPLPTPHPLVKDRRKWQVLLLLFQRKKPWRHGIR